MKVKVMPTMTPEELTKLIENSEPLPISQISPSKDDVDEEQEGHDREE